MGSWSHARRSPRTSSRRWLSGPVPAEGRLAIPPGRPSLVRRAVSLLVLLLTAWLVWAVVIFTAQRRMLFPGRTAAAFGEGQSLPGARLHRIELPDAQVEAWWLP